MTCTCATRRPHWVSRSLVHCFPHEVCACVRACVCGSEGVFFHRFSCSVLVFAVLNVRVHPTAPHLPPTCPPKEGPPSGVALRALRRRGWLRRSGCTGGSPPSSAPGGRAVPSTAPGPSLHRDPPHRVWRSGAAPPVPLRVSQGAPQTPRPPHTPSGAAVVGWRRPQGTRPTDPPPQRP